MKWNEIREKLKKNNMIHSTIVKVKQFYFFYIRKWKQNFEGWRRKKNGSEFFDLREYKDKYKGERCFIVCTGPSLTFDDLKLIQDEYSFGMNSITKIFSETEWRPTFYGIQDKLVYAKMEEEISNLVLDNIFISDEIANTGMKLPCNATIFPLNLYGHEYFNFKNPKYKFSDDAVANVYDGFSITYSLMQIAYYMGFSQIYLLGCDCSYAKEPEKQHFVSSGHVDPNAHLVGGLQTGAYKAAHKFCDSHDLKIYNATRGGYLEVFERVNLEEVINK